MPSVRLEGTIGSVVQILYCAQEKNKVTLNNKVYDKRTLSPFLETSEILELDFSGQGH